MYAPTHRPSMNLPTNSAVMSNIIVIHEPVMPAMAITIMASLLPRFASGFARMLPNTAANGTMTETTELNISWLPITYLSSYLYCLCNILVNELKYEKQSPTIIKPKAEVHASVMVYKYLIFITLF